MHMRILTYLFSTRNRYYLTSMQRGRFHAIVGVAFAAMLVIGCAGEVSSASEGLSDAGSSAAIGFEPMFLYMESISYNVSIDEDGYVYAQ